MALNYNPKDASNCLPAGEYDATLEKVDDTVSKSSGQPMQVWTFRAYGEKEMLVTDYVVVPGAVFKIRQLARALGKEADFNAGRFQAEEYIGQGVKLALTIESQDGYDDKNKVGKIMAPIGGTPPTTPHPARPVPRKPATSPISQRQEFEDADVPF